MAATLAAVLRSEGSDRHRRRRRRSRARGRPRPPREREAKPTAFNVRVTSSFVRHHVTHVVAEEGRDGLPSAATTSTRRQTIRASTRETGADDAGRDPPRRQGHRRACVRARSEPARYWVGWEEGCPLLATQPAERSTTTGCGATRSFYISRSLTGVGFAGAGKFRLTYAGGEPDPFGVRCLPEFYGGDAGLGSHDPRLPAGRLACTAPDEAQVVDDRLSRAKLLQR